MVRIAIVGAGIGGCSAAYFARKYIPSSELTIYETENRIGGRILTYIEDGVNLELGATFFNHMNKTIWDIIKAENLSIRKINERMDFAIWNGSKIIFKSNKHNALTTLNLHTQYGLSMTKTLILLREAQSKIRKLYNEERGSSADVTEIFKSTGLDRYYRKPLDESLIERGVSRAFIDEVVTPITRSIYCQNADLGGFAGLSALIGVYNGPVYSLTEGNNVLPMHLAKTSKATLNLGQKARRIEKTSKGAYRVSTGKNDSVFDGVIIATPLEHAGIALDGVSAPKLEPQLKQEVYVKVMRGILDPTYFSLKESSEVPAIVLTTREADPIAHFRIHKLPDNQVLLAITSTQSIPDGKLNGVLKSGETKVIEHHWKAAYPTFTPIEKLPPTRFDDKLMYLNSIESAVASMETSALAAKQAAKMISSKLK